MKCDNSAAHAHYINTSLFDDVCECERRCHRCGKRKRYIREINPNWSRWTC